MGLGVQARVGLGVQARVGLGVQAFEGLGVQACVGLGVQACKRLGCVLYPLSAQHSTAQQGPPRHPPTCHCPLHPLPVCVYTTISFALTLSAALTAEEAMDSILPK